MRVTIATMRVKQDFFFGIDRVFEHHYFETLSDVVLDSEPRSLLLCLDAGRTPFEHLKPLALSLLESGGVFFCCHGYSAKMVHDAIDWVRVEREIRSGEFGLRKAECERKVIMTTWHDNEPLSEVVEFWCRYGYPPAEWGPVRNWTSVVIGDRDAHESIQRHVATRQPTDLELGRI